MSNSAFIYSDMLLNYQFHRAHPFNQKRILITKELLEASKILNESEIISPRIASDDELLLFHDAIYVDAVKEASRHRISYTKGKPFGLGTEDTPIFTNMHEASCYIVGGSLAAVDAVLEQGMDHALHLGGGLHHSFKRKAAGFCVYNDAAIAIQYIRKNYGLRVLYVDTDAHHGDGVQAAFYGDSDVCTLSIHETGRYLFPGTGQSHERGIKHGRGYTFNIPIDAFTDDESFLYVYESAFRNICQFFKPDIIITQNGADAHTYDPLSHLCTTMTIYKQIPMLAHELAHEFCRGKWIALGGGGYDIWRVVPRAWAQVWSVMKTGQPQSGAIPNAWIHKWQKEASVSLPTYWHDDKTIVPHIPRKKEIANNNARTLAKALKYILSNKRR